MQNSGEEGPTKELVELDSLNWTTSLLSMAIEQSQLILSFCFDQSIVRIATEKMVL